MRSHSFFCLAALAGSALGAAAKATTTTPVITAAITAVITPVVTAVTVTAATAPVTTARVNLGYEVHQGSLNATGDYYVFSNVPYAQQPVGSLRFQKPVAVTGSSVKVNTGSTTGVMCIQAYPQWIIDIYASANGVSEAQMAAILSATPGQTESCLLLDVYVPASVLAKGAAAKAPVLVWIHGGGFTSGSKDSAGNPAGLLAQSQINGDAGAIVVTINYRLGLFGWISGAGFTSNLGLYDQRMALQWVQTYISKFGGNPAMVTVMGESAGAASILHHITAYGGAQSNQFDNAILQSPAYQFGIDAEASYELVLDAAEGYLSTFTQDVLDDLGALGDLLGHLLAIAELYEDPTSTLQTINQAVVFEAGTGMFNFGPVIDGTYVPNVPQVLLAQGSFDKTVNVMAGHNSNESIPFTPTSVYTDALFTAYVKASLPNIAPAALQELITVIYPPVYDGTYGYWSEFGRLAQLEADFFFACSTNYLATAYGNATYNYIFAYPPGYHGEDVPYTFFNGDTSSIDDGLPVNPALAIPLQDYLMSFVKTGNPNYVGSTQTFPAYGTAGAVLEFTYFGLTTGVDDMKNSRCAWLQQSLVAGLIV